MNVLDLLSGMECLELHVGQHLPHAHCLAKVLTLHGALHRADEVIVSTGESGEDIEKRVKEITDGSGAYATIDAVGGALTAKLLAATRRQGTLLVYGAMSGLEFDGGIPDVLFQLKVRHPSWQWATHAAV